jgi:hypothetical protein
LLDLIDLGNDALLVVFFYDIQMKVLSTDMRPKMLSSLFELRQLV